MFDLVENAHALTSNSVDENMLKHGVRRRHIQTGKGLFLLFNQG
jgi:hypothetical protein